MADLKDAYKDIIPPRDLTLPKEMDPDKARKEIQIGVQEQGIAGVVPQDIKAKTDELYKEWENFDGHSITFRKTVNGVESVVNGQQKKQHSGKSPEPK